MKRSKGHIFKASLFDCYSVLTLPSLRLFCENDQSQMMDNDQHHGGRTDYHKISYRRLMDYHKISYRRLSPLLFWPKSKCYDYLYQEAEMLLRNYPVQATISFYEDSDSDDDSDSEEEEELN
ncbi:UNVERIFIED_CONTAM: hypothetical protein FKN15_077862 [Acipenser sinensis]